MSESGEAPYFTFGDWIVRPAQRSIERGEERITLEPKLMDVLAYLAASGGGVVSADKLLVDCWRGTFYGDNPVHKTIALLRKALGDDARVPRYIATVRKRGYQVIAEVAFADERQRGQPARHTWTGGSPYRGLLHFDAGHAPLFFGRARAIAELLAALRAQQAAGCAFALVTGPSGSGKSSLIHAGVVPALLREAGSDGVRATSWSSVAARPHGMLPLEALALALTRWEVAGRPIFLETEREALASSLRTDIDSVLKRIEHAMRDQPSGALLVLVIETLEALTTSPQLPIADLAAFVEVLSALARCGRVAVLVLCRNDFYPSLMAVPGLLALKRDGCLYDVAAPTEGEIAQMIRLPAIAAGLSFERDAQTERQLDDVLLDAAAHHAGSLPLLQYTLQALYETRGPKGELTFAAYRELGGLEGALARRAEQVFSQLDSGATAAFDTVLRRLISVASDGDGITARSVRWCDLEDAGQHDVVRRLVDAHLMVSMLDADEPCFTVAHEALLRHWPRILDWVAAHRAMLRSRARITEMARRWKEEGQRQEHLIPPGLLLADARSMHRNTKPSLDAAEQRFVAASLRRARLGATARAVVSCIILALAFFLFLATLAARRAEQRAEHRRADAEGLLDFMLGDLHERLDELGRLDLLDAVTGRAMAVLDNDGQSDDPDAVLRKVTAMREVGEIRFARGDLESALAAFTSARHRVHDLVVREPTLAEAYAEQGKIDYWRGQIASKRGQREDARVAWTQYLTDAQQRMALEPASPDAWLELSYANNNLGTFAVQGDQLDEAAKRFEQSAQWKQRVLGAVSDDRKTRLELADTMSWLASVQLQRGELHQALDAFVHEREAVLAAREKGDPSNLWRYREALSNLRVAKAEADLGQYAAAAPDYAKAVASFAALVDQVPDNRNWQRDLAYARLQQGWLAYAMGDTALAQRRLSEAESGLHALLARDQTMADWHALLALVRNDRAVIALRGGDAVAARGLLDAAWTDLAVQGRAAKTAGGMALNAILEITSGEAAAAQGDRNAMTRHWLNVIEQLGPRVAESHDPRLLDPFVRASVLLGRNNEAAPYLQRLDQSGYRPPMFESYLSSIPSRQKVQ
ncbi:winged helix-turn-helix domain-containing protein [Dyella sp.]|uniref:nSTAND1 domain-containing NTPase n=1 Tax=Dyella sp. TaxID=1869338 RepID=UPI002ED06C42